MPTSPVERLGHSFSPRVEVVATADHRHHRTHSGTNGSSSNVLPPRLHLIVHVVGLDATCVVHRRNGTLPPIIVAHRRSGTMNAADEPPLA